MYYKAHKHICRNILYTTLQEIKNHRIVYLNQFYRNKKPLATIPILKGQYHNLNGCMRENSSLTNT